MTLLNRSFETCIVAAIDDVLRSMSACDRSMSSSQVIDLFLEIRFEVTLRDALERHLMSAR